MRLKLPARFSEQAAAPGFIAPAQRVRRKSVPKVTVKEKDLQALAENLCLSLGIRFFRIPDKLMGFLAHHAPAWTRIFVSRYLAGVPDLLLFKALPGSKNEVLFLEIKTEAGKISPTQARWHSGLNIIVARGWAETEAAIREFAGREAR